MRGIIGLIVGLVVPLAGCGQSATKFDLACTPVQGAATDVPTLRYRMDLDRKRYCVDDCDHVWAIDKVSDLEISDTSGLKFDRQTGTMEFSLLGPDVYRFDCTKQKFSGFPKSKF